MFRNGSDESSYHRKRIRKYSESSHTIEFHLPIGFRLFAITKFFIIVINRKGIRLSGTGAVELLGSRLQSCDTIHCDNTSFHIATDVMNRKLNIQSERQKHKVNTEDVPTG